MALAEYHGRAALAASQVIAGFDEARFRLALESATVGVGIGREAAGNAEGVALLDLTVRLLARLYPSIELRAQPGCESAADAMAELARAINPLIELSEGAAAGVSIGADAPRFPTTFFAGSDGWDALISAAEPVAAGVSPNPLGAGVAACLAAADLFKFVLMPDWELRRTGDVRFSTFGLNQKRAPGAEPNDSWEMADDTVLVGLGAVGNGAVWALARAPLTGRLHLVDHESVELSNLQRYVLAERADDGRAKVELAAHACGGPLEVVEHPWRWAEFVQRQHYHWPRVLVALDSAAARRSVQASLPEWIANAWTQPGDLGLSVHGRFDGSGACLACLYLPGAATPNEDEVVAAALGVPQLAGEVRTLLHNGAGVSRELLEVVAGSLGLDHDVVLNYEGRPVRALYVEGVCGGGLIALGATGTPPQDLHVPLAHQSALAGVLLAAALARRAVVGTYENSTQVTRIDVLGPLGEYITQPALKAGTGMCICEDVDYLGVFAAKYPVI